MRSDEAWRLGTVQVAVPGVFHGLYERPTGSASLDTSLDTTLDRAVWAAYGWDDDDLDAVPEDDILARLLALNLERAPAK
jgi:hypothetical protein